MALPNGSIRFCISTCKRFAPHTLPVIIPSLLAAGIEPKEILVVNGGQTTHALTSYEDVPMLLTHQNSLSINLFGAKSPKFSPKIKLEIDKSYCDVAPP